MRALLVQMLPPRKGPAISACLGDNRSMVSPSEVEAMSEHNKENKIHRPSGHSSLGAQILISWATGAGLTSELKMETG